MCYYFLNLKSGVSSVVWDNITRSLNTKGSALECKVPEYWRQAIMFQVANQYIFLKWPAFEKDVFKALICFK